MREINNLKQKRPFILILIIIFYFIAAVMLFIVSIIAFTNNDILLNIPDLSNFNQDLLPKIFVILGYIMGFLSVLYLFLAFGLVFNKNWARLGLIILCIIYIIGGIFSITEQNYISIINLTINLLIGSYLLFNKKVRLLFTRSKEKLSEKEISKRSNHKEKNDNKDEIKRIIENIKDKSNKK